MGHWCAQLKIESLKITAGADSNDRARGRGCGSRRAFLPCGLDTYTCMVKKVRQKLMKLFSRANVVYIFIFGYMGGAW